MNEHHRIGGRVFSFLCRINRAYKVRKKLRGFVSRYRLRQGNYRIVYEIDEERKVVRIFIVGHRKDVYRGM